MPRPQATGGDRGRTRTRVLRPLRQDGQHVREGARREERVVARVVLLRHVDGVAGSMRHLQ
jgi:hypothetical protein